MLLVFEFYLAAWFLKVGNFPNHYVPFPPENAHKLQTPQFCSLQSIIEKFIFKKSLLSFALSDIFCN